MCSNCISLTSLPDVQKICDLQNSDNISMYKCISLSSFPDFHGKRKDKDSENNINAINYK